MWRVIAYILLIVHQVVVGQTLLGQLNLHSSNDSILFPGGLPSRVNNNNGNNKPHQIATLMPEQTTTVMDNASKVATTETSQITQETTTSSESNTQLPTEISLDEIRRLNDITDITEFERQFVSPLIANRFLSIEDPAPFTIKNGAESPKPAKCEPEMTTVPLQSSENSFSLIFPSCTRVKRCGGCCNSELLSCQPAQTIDRYFQVYVSEYTNGRLLFNKKDVITVEEHTKCKCDCKIKKEHCNSFQTYHQKDCRCKCFNQEDRQKCENDNVTKIWNYETCMCRCREISDCSTGYLFDEQTCSCKPEPVIVTRFNNDGDKRRRRPSDGNRNHYGYITSPVQQQRQSTSNRKS